MIDKEYDYRKRVRGRTPGDLRVLARKVGRRKRGGPDEVQLLCAIVEELVENIGTTGTLRRAIRRTPVVWLSIRTRTQNILVDAGYTEVSQIMWATDKSLLQIYGFGRTSLAAVRDAIEDMLYAQKSLRPPDGHHIFHAGVCVCGADTSEWPRVTGPAVCPLYSAEERKGR